MIRLAATACAVALFWAPLRLAPMPPVAVTGLAALLLAAGAVATLRRGLATAAACVFLIDYAAALWIAGGPARIGGAAGFGLALLFFLETVDMGRRLRRATVGAGVARSMIACGLGVSVATGAAAMLVMTAAGAAAASIPFAAAPFLAAAGAVGVVLAVAAAVTGAARAASRPRPDAPST
jgi:hypothetical protein